MAKMWGADVEALERVGLQMERAGGQLRDKGRRLARGLESAPWHGRNADRYRSEFNSVHLRAIGGAARFLDDAYEHLLRNADEQRRASGLPSRSVFRRIMLEIQRRLYWIDRFPWVTRLPFWPGPRLFPMPMPMPFPWRRITWPILWPPGFRLPDIRPVLPGDWIQDVLVGVGVGGGGITAILDRIGGTTPEAGGPRKPSAKEGSVPPAPSAPRPAAPPVRQGPHQFSQSKLVEIATGAVGTSMRAVGPDGSTWNQPGQCIMWVDRWLDAAGLPGGLPGGTAPFEQFEQLGGVRIDVGDLRPGDVFQRAVPGDWGTRPHTAIVKSYDPATGTLVLIEGNVPADSGLVAENPYTLDQLQRAGHEIRFYRLGRV